MSEYLSEEEQLESLKRWWRENGLQTILSVLLVMGAWYGWQYWQDYKRGQAEDASLEYIKMMDIAAKPASGQEQLAKFHLLADQLKDSHPGSHYAHFAALLLARLAVEQNDLKTAKQELEWVLAKNSDEAMTFVVKLRLARVEAAMGDPDSALALVEKSPKEFNSMYAEARGDFFTMKKDTESARAAYQSALDSLDAEDADMRSVLEMKLNQVMTSAAPESSKPEKS